MEDTVYRRDAINAVSKWFYDVFGIKESDGTATIFKRLRELPSAQSDVFDINVVDTVSRQAAIKAFDGSGFCTHGYIVDVLEGLPFAQTTYTDEEIQKMQELEQAQIEKAYQLGYEEGKKEVQAERKMGRWIVKRLYVQCSECGDCFPLKPQNYCPNCGADMRGEQNDIG